MTKSKIEWTDEVWNPVTGCSKVSQGCKHCYAETIANRFWGNQEIATGRTVKSFEPSGEPIEGKEYRPRKFTDVMTHPERLDAPLKWRKPRRVFVNSMSDLFHENVPGWFQRKVFDVMKDTPRHTYMVLTKRPAGMFSWTINYQNPPLSNVWLGVSVEDQATADERIPLLLQTPSAVRFVSYEPALGPVDFQGWDGRLMRDYLRHRPGEDTSRRGPLDWIIMGGESGPGARPMHPDWVRSTRDQCQAAGVPFFFKQWGEWRQIVTPLVYGIDYESVKYLLLDGSYGTQKHWYDGAAIGIERVGKKTAGRLLDGYEWSEFPEVKP